MADGINAPGGRTGLESDQQAENRRGDSALLSVSYYRGLWIKPSDREVCPTLVSLRVNTSPSTTCFAA